MSPPLIRQIAVYGFSDPGKSLGSGHPHPPPLLGASQDEEELGGAAEATLGENSVREGESLPGKRAEKWEHGIK